MARKQFIFQWILWSTILSFAYKGTLLSILTTERYSVPINTLQQMEKSGLPFYIPDVCIHFLINDPREEIENLRAKWIVMPFLDMFKEETNEKYSKSFRRQKMI